MFRSDSVICRLKRKIDFDNRVPSSIYLHTKIAV